MKLFPSRSQWGKWSLPSKAGYAGAWLGAIALLTAIFIPLYQTVFTIESRRPLISILSLDSYLGKESMETKFIIKNVGGKPAFVLINAEASIGTNRIEPNSKKFETKYQTIMPGQIIKYRGFYIKGSDFQMILTGTSIPEITQTINIIYGVSEKTIGEYHTFQKVKLDLDKLTRVTERSQTFDGLWLLEESKSK